MILLIQGGLRHAITNFGVKKAQGQIVCPVRLDRDGNVEAAVRELLFAAEKPVEPIRIDTNHAISDLALATDLPGSDNNDLITFDCLLVKQCVLSAEEKGEVKLTIDVEGTIDVRSASTLVAPPADHVLGRAITFADCDAYRYQSAMRRVASFEFKVANEILTPTFLIPYDAPTRNDQPSAVICKGSKWSGQIVEIMAEGAEAHTYVKGAMVGENLTLNFGPISAIIRVPVFKPAQQPLTSGVLKRTTEFWAQVQPRIGYPQGDLFTYLEP